MRKSVLLIAREGYFHCPLQSQKSVSYAKKRWFVRFLSKPGKESGGLSNER